MQLSGAQLLCRAAESEARLGRDPRSWAAIPTPPYCLVPGQGGCPGWRPQGGISWFAMASASRPPPSQREEQAATAGVHFSAQSTSCLSSGILCTPAPNFQPERETSWISEPRLPVCDSTHSCRGHFLSKTTQSLGHTPSSLLTLELMKKRE